MRHRHEMPFGAQYAEEATRFRLWAPACESVRLELGLQAPRSIAMQRAKGGWHETIVADVKPGEAYAFRLNDPRSTPWGPAPRSTPWGPAVPDPASRSNPCDVDGPSAVVDPRAYEWRDDSWTGRPWHEAVVYELHVGTFTDEGTYLGAIEKIDHLVGLGITAIELMPLADFAGRRNWGYDGVLPFAPDAAYGTPEELKRLVDAAHQRGLMVLLDVVYNHFGPEGNHLGSYAPQFFNAAHQTPWGAAINFDGDDSRTVRDFFVHNALYWIEELRFDGLRMDAIHAIADKSPKHIVTEIAEAVAAGPGRSRRVHIVLENDRNEAGLLERDSHDCAKAQWNDDAHHAFHVLVTGERDGYYRDYADRPAWHLGRTLAEGFAYQGEPSTHRAGEARGERSAHLPLDTFVPFLQNHDQVGNRALGERLTLLASPEALRLASAVLLLAPSVPLIFMGEEFGARSPFLYFCDFQGELASAVRDGRRREFATFDRFAGDSAHSIPDPNAEKTFLDSKLAWGDIERGEHAGWLAHYRGLLQLRAREITPRLAKGTRGAFEAIGATGVKVDWSLGDGSRLHLRANFSTQAAAFEAAPGEALHTEGVAPVGRTLAPWSGVWTVERA